MGPAITIAIIVLVIAVNIIAIYVGNDRYSFFGNVASVFGRLGLFTLLALVIAAFDAFTNIWVKREGYEGWPVIICFYTTVGFTLISLVACITIRIQDRRNS